jgi:hypothetical protein
MRRKKKSCRAPSEARAGLPDLDEVEGRGEEGAEAAGGAAGEEPRGQAVGLRRASGEPKQERFEGRKKAQPQPLVAQPAQAAGHNPRRPEPSGAVLAPDVPGRTPQAALLALGLQPHFEDFRGKEQRFEQRRRHAPGEDLAQQAGRRPWRVARGDERGEEAQDERGEGAQALRLRVRTQPPQPTWRSAVVFVAPTVYRSGVGVG